MTAARSVGLLGAAKPTDYERWIERVEPHLWSPTGHLDALPTEQQPHLHISVTVADISEPVDITATTISLSDQSWPRWTATLVVPATASPDTAAAVQRAVTHDARLTLQIGTAVNQSSNDSGLSPTSGPTYVGTIEAGTTFSRQSFAELALCAVQSDADAIVADVDSMSALAGRREHPLLLTSLHPDLVDQFDLSSAFLLRRRGTEEMPLADLIATGRPALVRHVVAHRKRTQPPQLGLRASHPGDSATTGTRVRHHVEAKVTATVVIRDPLTDSRSASHHRSQLLANPGESVNIDNELVVARSTPAGLVLPTINSEFVVIVDGGTLPQERGWLEDLVGACRRDHVLAVSPLIVAPSGVAFDAGVEAVDPDEIPTHLRARSGRLDIPPYDLGRVTPVPSLSCRVIVMRADDVNSLEVLSSRTVFERAWVTNRSNLIWAHQRWGVESALREISPLTPGMAAWKVGRIGRWFDVEVAPHEPAVWRVGEGVW